MAPKIIFYRRVSTRDQKPDSQVAAARRLGVKDAHIFVEKASGARHDRPVLDKALAVLEEGDTLACFKLDRLGRSLVQLVSNRGPRCPRHSLHDLGGWSLDKGEHRQAGTQHSGLDRAV